MGRPGRRTNWQISTRNYSGELHVTEITYILRYQYGAWPYDSSRKLECQKSKSGTFCFCSCACQVKTTNLPGLKTHWIGFWFCSISSNHFISLHWVCKQNDDNHEFELLHDAAVHCKYQTLHCVIPMSVLQLPTNFNFKSNQSISNYSSNEIYWWMQIAKYIHSKITATTYIILTTYYLLCCNNYMTPHYHISRSHTTYYDGRRMS